MSNCCSSSDAKRNPASIDACPSCGATGKAVGTLTVKQMVIDHTSVLRNDPYWFCRNPGCDVVYFAPGSLFAKADVKVRVGIKEQTDPVPLCYCFGYERKDVRRDIEERGSTEIAERIKTEIQSGFCACEAKNPSGKCCLGDITRVIREIKQQLSQAVKLTLDGH